MKQFGPSVRPPGLLDGCLFWGIFLSSGCMFLIVFAVGLLRILWLLLQWTNL